MAALAQGRAIVTNHGTWSEPIWRASGAVELVPCERTGAAGLALLNDPDRLVELGRRAASLYRQRFALEHTIRAVRAVYADLPAAVAG
jgi:hypothetical protein